MKRDAPTGRASEIITIHRVQRGTYSYLVDHLDGEQNIYQAGAVVRIRRGPVSIMEFYPPQFSGDYFGWWVLEIRDGEVFE